METDKARQCRALFASHLENVGGGNQPPGLNTRVRRVVTGASTADLAVILVDARKGILTQTRRHSTLVHLLGIRNIVLAVNKMDLVDYSEKTFNDIVAPRAGKVTAIMVEDGQPVEYGEPLLVIE